MPLDCLKKALFGPTRQGVIRLQAAGGPHRRTDGCN